MCRVRISTLVHCFPGDLFILIRSWGQKRKVSFALYVESNLARLAEITDTNHLLTSFHSVKTRPIILKSALFEAKLFRKLSSFKFVQ